MSEASGQRPMSEGFWSLLGRDNDAEDEVPTDAETLEEDCPFDEEERQLLERRRELKALLLASRQRADALASAIDAQVDEVMCQEKHRMHVIDELSQHCSDLQHAQEQRQQELLQELEKLNAATQQCSECENRSQFLVERIITLLACSPLDAEHVGVLKAKHRAEREMLRQFEDIRQQYDEVRQQNVELTSRLLEESSFSRRLSDQLAEAEERFNRCTPQDGSLQSSSTSQGAMPEASNASSATSTSTSTSGTSGTLHLALPRCEVEGDSRREEPGPVGWTPPAPRSARARRPVGALGVLAEAEGGAGGAGGAGHHLGGTFHVVWLRTFLPQNLWKFLWMPLDNLSQDCIHVSLVDEDFPIAVVWQKPKCWHSPAINALKQVIRYFFPKKAPTLRQVSDQVALGTACQCGGTKCEKSMLGHCLDDLRRANLWVPRCEALEEDGTPSCEEMSRQDPSLLDLYGISKNGPGDGKDAGAINGRELKFYKKSANSGLRFFYSDNFRVYGSHSASRWELKIDGATCPSGKMAQDLHVQPGMNPHRGMPEIYGVRGMTPAIFGVNLRIEAYIYMQACMYVCIYIWWLI
ncbi:unnamed protein product [Cladocopium goreaui]|uniref:Uncharacterized protein n=1 Tax=Cladocopium goreaui TaxID=2562237 RepID=A0A9P1DJA2_9DINO|nr:unnamed protein product [Cladocopium goreaui]